MGRVAEDSEEAKAIDAALGAWRQGDLALDEDWFVHVGDPKMALTPAAEAADGDAGEQALSYDVSGLAVISQTCDIVRPCMFRPYVEVAPLVKMEAADLLPIQRGYRPAFVTTKALVERELAVDLERVMTLEKSIVARWTRTPGCTTEEEARHFAQALARKRARFAFPDDFAALVSKLQNRVLDKHDKGSEEGRGLRALREIRVQGTPDWDAAAVHVFFWFIRFPEHDDFEGAQWSKLLEKWLSLVGAHGRFEPIEGQVATLEDMTAAEYVASDPLDLDHLTTRTASS